MKKLGTNILLGLLALTLLAACGGGGGGNGSTPTPSISNFSASASSIPAGASVNLTALFADGAGSIDNGVGAVTSGTAISVSPATTTTYTLTVADTAGNSVTSTVTVTVTTPSISSFTTSAVTIPAGASVNLTAVFTDGTGSIDNAVGAVTTGNAVSVTPAVTTTYTLTVSDGVNSVTSAVTVTVLSLSSLSINNGALDQVFQASQASYTATVGYLATSIKVIASTANTGAAVTVNGVAVDANNSSQSITLTEGANSAISIVVTAADTTTHTYTLTVTRQTSASFAEQAYFKASNTGLDDKFGYRVALSGDTLAVGAYLEDSSSTGSNSTPDELSIDSGAVYVFTRSGSTWSQQAYIKASNPMASAYFGASLALSGDTLAVGAYGESGLATGAGAVYVFTRSGTTWSQQDLLRGSNAAQGDQFGYSVALDNDTLVAGALREDSSTSGVNTTPDDLAQNAGAAYVFTRSGTSWSEQAYLKASNTDAGDQFGYSVAVSGDSVAVGAWREDSNATGVNPGTVAEADNSAFWAGAVYVFMRSGSSWSQQAYIKASNTDGGDATTNPVTAGDTFGASIAIHDDTLVVGAYLERSSAQVINGDETDNAFSGAGAVYVFTRSGSTWSQQAYIKPHNAAVGDWFGYSVAVYDNTLVVGAVREDSVEQGLTGSGVDDTAQNAGAVYLFTRSGTTWTQQKYIKSSNNEGGDWFGVDVAIDAGLLTVGAWREDSSTSGINSTPDNNLNDAGAAYVFE